MVKVFLRYQIFGIAWGALIWLLEGLNRAVFVHLFGTNAISRRELLHAFGLGARFDLAVVGYALLVYSLIAVIVSGFGDRPLWTRVTRGLLMFFSLVIVGLQAANLGFYSYFHDHFNLRIYELFRDDTWAILVTSWRDLPLLRAVGSLGFFVLFMRWFLHRVDLWAQSFVSTRRPTTAHAVFIFVIPFIVFFLFGRGSLNFVMPPLGRMNIDVSQDPFVNQTAFNSIFAFADTLKQSSSRMRSYDLIRAMGYKDHLLDAYSKIFDGKSFKSLEEARAQFWHEPRKIDVKTNQPPHVVVFLMESMGAYWLKFNSDKFPILGGLERHFAEDFVWHHFLPSCSGTYCTAAYLLMNSPTLPGPNLTEAHPEAGDFLAGVAEPFRAAGYRTVFVYGGGLGWRSLTTLAPKMGFQEQYGSQQIKSALGTRTFVEHDWGVMDEHVMDFVAKTLDDTTKPTFVFVLTTTNHPPFKTPENYKGRYFDQIPEPLKSRVSMPAEKFSSRLRCYQYANHQLSRFMDHIKSSPLAEHTLVGITGDHNFFDAVTFSPEEFADWKGVPFYLYVPKTWKAQFDVEKWASQDSIFPTLYDLALPNQRAYYFGQSLLDPNRVPRAINEDGFLLDQTLVHQGKTYLWNSESQRFSQTHDPKDLARSAEMTSWLKAYYAAIYDALMSAKK